VHKLDKKVVLDVKIKFSIESYNSFYDMELNGELIKQYEVEGLEGLLLSPRGPYAYIFADSAGAHKSIRGHDSFFEMDLTHTVR
jgi:hypothetical protein